MHHFTPAPLIARLRYPFSPVSDRVLERFSGLRLRVLSRDVRVWYLLQQESGCLTRLQAEFGEHALLSWVQWYERFERQRQALRPEQNPGFVKEHVMRVARVIEARFD